MTAALGAAIIAMETFRTIRLKLKAKLWYIAI